MLTLLSGAGKQSIRLIGYHMMPVCFQQLAPERAFSGCPTLLSDNSTLALNHTVAQSMEAEDFSVESWLDAQHMPTQPLSLAAECLHRP